MSLKTYSRRGGSDAVAAIDRTSNTQPPKLTPGMWVEQPGWGGFGVVVAVTDKQVTVLWSVVPHAFSFPNVRVAPAQGTISQQLVKVQPMTAPAGGIFYMDYTYGDETVADMVCKPASLLSRMWGWVLSKTRSSGSSLARWFRSQFTKRLMTGNNDEISGDWKRLVKKWSRHGH